MDQKIKTYYPPPGHAKRVAQNKKLRDEQKPSLKNTIKKLAKGTAKIVGTVNNVATKKLNNFLKDEKRINRIEGDLFGEMDDKFKKMGPSAKGTWINSPPPAIKKKKKTKKVK